MYTKLLSLCIYLIEECVDCIVQARGKYGEWMEMEEPDKEGNNP